MKGIFNNVTQMSMNMMESLVKPEDAVMDMTMGNGNDTLFLAKRARKVYAFDIQKEALKNTKSLLEKEKISNVVTILDSHENVLEHVREEVSFIIYNLGYLPKGDKTIVTKVSSTLKSLEGALSLLKVEGVILICAYVGHEGGMEEYEQILSFTKNLDKKQYNVLNMKHENRRETSPRMIVIEKIG